MHKKSPKKYPGSSSKGRKARDRTEKQTRRHLRLDSSDNDEASERESDEERAESPFFTGSRQVASKQAGSVINNKSISKKSRVKEESSSSQSEDDDDLKLRKREHHQHGKEKGHHHKGPSSSSKYH